MKKIFFILFALLGKINAQLPYTWTTGTDPGWTSVNSGAGGGMQWRPGCLVVTTNCTGNYSNNALSTYTSPVINASCTNASTISITFTASGNAEFSYDFLFVEYSTNGGVTWINPYGPGIGWTGNFGGGTTIPPIITSTSSNFRFRFTFDSDFSFVSSGYRLLDFDIVCNPVLPVELVEFKGHKDGARNIITWITASEVNNDYFTIEKSIDAINWEFMQEIKGAGSSNSENSYLVYDNKPNTGVTYYRLHQTDYDGTTKIYDPISIDNNDSFKTITMITDPQGKEYGTQMPNHIGMFIVYYSDKTVEKVYKGF